jgi:F-type H+-transporting ATPase subunit gamma
VLENLQSRMRFEDVDAPLLEERPVQTITLLAVTGDRGLCGGYNANIIKRTEQRHAELSGQGYAVDLVLIGRKAITYFQNRASQYSIRATFTGLEQVPNAEEARGIANEILAEFLSASTDRVEIIFTRFINLVSSRPVIQTLLPLDPQGIATPEDEIFRLTTREGRLVVEPGSSANAAPALPSDIVFEQSPEQLLNALLPLYLQNQLLRSLQEAAASELASRMTAMNNASDNAKALAKTLTLDYNKARQAAITQEILEVVGGASAMG